MSDQNARLYARALHEVLIADWQRQLRSLAGRLEHKATASAEEQIEAIEAALPPDAPATLRNFLLTLARENSLRLLSHIADALGSVAGLDQLATAAEVQSAVELTGEQKQKIERELAERYQRGLDVRYTVDPAILGGLIIRVGDQIIDTSVRTHLSALHRSMVAG